MSGPRKQLHYPNEADSELHIVYKRESGAQVEQWDAFLIFPFDITTARG